MIQIVRQRVFAEAAEVVAVRRGVDLQDLVHQFGKVVRSRVVIGGVVRVLHGIGPSRRQRRQAPGLRPHWISQSPLRGRLHSSPTSPPVRHLFATAAGHADEHSTSMPTDCGRGYPTPCPCIACGESIRIDPNRPTPGAEGGASRNTASKKWVKIPCFGAVLWGSQRPLPLPRLHLNQSSSGPSPA